MLVVFGANRCPDCRALDREFHAGGRTESRVEERYEVVEVDVGRFDRNLDFVKLYGEPIRKGIPSVVVVTPADEVVYRTRAGELADARHLGADGIHAFFGDRADRPVGSRARSPVGRSSGRDVRAFTRERAAVQCASDAVRRSTDVLWNRTRVAARPQTAAIVSQMPGAALSSSR